MPNDPSIATRVTIEAVDRLDGAVQERLRQMSKGRLREMIPRAIDGRFRLCVPPMDDDDDLILSALIDEVFALREQVAAQRESNQRLIDQHGTFPHMGYKSELKGL